MSNFWGPLLLGIGHNSAFIVIEAQIQYIMDTLHRMQHENITRIDVKLDQQHRYNLKIQQELQSTVWNTGGCTSYYLDQNGRNSVGFPWHTLKMRSLLSRWDSNAYIINTKINTATNTNGN